jgi:hypothetical protein
MYLRKPSKALTHHDVRTLVSATHFAEGRGKPLTATLTIHPAMLNTYPPDVGQWVSDFLNKLRIWCNRAGFGYFAIWVRENYEGDRREHLHVLLSVPERQRSNLEEAARRWLPGDPAVIEIGRPEFAKDGYSRRVNKALTYMLKQMTPQAWAALGRAVRREKHCRRTSEPVAPIMGKRCGVSRSLNEAARRAFWVSPAGKLVETAHPAAQDKAA